MNPEYFQVKSNLKGTLGESLIGVMAEVRITPMVLADDFATLITKLTTPMNLKRGQLLFGGTDKPLVIQTQDGRSQTFAAAAITGWTLNLSPNRNLVTDLTFLCLRKNATALSDAAAFVAETSSAYSEPSEDLAEIVSDVYTLAWGASFTDIETDENGLTFSPQLDLTIRKTSKQGPYNAMVNDLQATATFTPENISAANFYDTWLKLDGTGARIGGMRAGDDHEEEFTATASQVGGPLLTIPRAVFQRGSVRFGGSGRIGQVTMRAVRPATGNLFTLAQVPTP